MAKKKLNQVQMYAEQTTGVRLSSHEKLCAYRMKEIQDSIKELSTEVKSLRQDVLKGKGAISVLLILGSFVAGIIGFFQFSGWPPIRFLGPCSGVCVGVRSWVTSPKSSQCWWVIRWVEFVQNSFATTSKWKHGSSGYH